LQTNDQTINFYYIIYLVHTVPEAKQFTNIHTTIQKFGAGKIF